jgi:hypothetical protein
LAVNKQVERLLIAGLIIAVLLNNALGQKKDGELEPVWGIRDTASEVLVRVESNGCTEETNFKIEKAEGRRVSMLRILRINPDSCKMKVIGGKMLAFEKKTIGLKQYEPFQLVNPILSPPDGSSATTEELGCEQKRQQ